MIGVGEKELDRDKDVMRKPVRNNPYISILSIYMKHFYIRTGERL